MAKGPSMKKIVDFYSGSDVVTAKKQQEELEKVAKSFPQGVPLSMKKFTDRALLSLQVHLILTSMSNSFVFLRTLLI